MMCIYVDSKLLTVLLAYSQRINIIKQMEDVVFMHRTLHVWSPSKVKRPGKREYYDALTSCLQKAGESEMDVDRINSCKVQAGALRVAWRRKNKSTISFFGTA